MKKTLLASLLLAFSVVAVEPTITTAAVVGAAKVAIGFILTNRDEIVSLQAQVQEVDLAKAKFFSDADGTLTIEEARTLEWQTKDCTDFEINFNPASQVGFDKMRFGIAFRYSWNTERKAIRLDLDEFKRISGAVPGSTYAPVFSADGLNEDGAHKVRIRFQIKKDANQWLELFSFGNIQDTARGVAIDFYSDGRTEIVGAENEFVRKIGDTEQADEKDLIVIGTCE